MKRQRNYSQPKQQEKTPENLNDETEISNLPDKEFKVLVLRMLTELGKRIDEHSDNSNKGLEHILKKQSELKNTIIEMKNTVQGMNSRLSDREEHISDLEDRIMEVIQSDHQKEKHEKK